MVNGFLIVKCFDNGLTHVFYYHSSISLLFLIILLVYNRIDIFNGIFFSIAFIYEIQI